MFSRPITVDANKPVTILIQPRLNLIVQRRYRRSEIEERVSNRAVERRLSAADDIVGQRLVIQRTISNRQTRRSKSDERKVWHNC